MLRINGNPFENGEKKYGPYFVSFFDELKYLDYKLVSKEDRHTAKELHKDENVDLENNAKEKEPGGESGQYKEYEDAGIGCTVDLLSNVMKCGPSYSAIECMSSYAELLTTSENVIEEKFTTYASNMKTLSNDRANLVKDCMTKFDVA